MSHDPGAATHALGAPSPWIRRWAPLIAGGGTVLDLACGSGRHLRLLAQLGFRLTGVDRDAAAAMPLAEFGEIVVADIESGPWPLAGRRFDAVVVTNYLWRPLLPRIVDSLGERGVLLYETFASGQETVGRPTRPDFQLQPGELLAATKGLRVVAFEDGYEASPGRFVQRIAAVRLASSDPGPARYPL